MSGCSSISEKLDIAGIIDKTENLIFGDEQKESRTEDIQDSEIAEFDDETYPDLSNIPDDRPDFAELDKEFFQNESLNKDKNFMRI